MLNPQSSKATIPLLKDPEERDAMRRANQAAAQCLTMIGAYVQPGVSTLELNDRAHDYMVGHLRAQPATLNYRGFPKSCCVSPNNVVCHGVPSAQVRLKSGDIVNVDISLELEGFFGDTSMSFIVGGRSKPYLQKLVRVARECLFLGIKAARPRGRLGDIGASIARHAHRNNFSVVQDYCGHGIGRAFHLEPQVLHEAERSSGPRLLPGMCFTIEPMINSGKSAVRVLDDGWTVVTRDGRASAQWEHTVMITETGVEILTLRPDESSPL